MLRRLEDLHDGDPRAALEQELAAPPRWMYHWELGHGLEAPLLGPTLPPIHETRAEMMEPAVRQALGAAGSEARALDIACNEGWFAHKLLEWGAAHVVGVDIREQNIRRAVLVRDHLGVPADRLDLIVGSAYDLQPAELGTFDVVLCIGLIYHLENPIGALRASRALCRGLCVVETQVTRHNAPIVHGWGRPDEYEITEGSWAAKYEPDQDANPLASFGGIVSLIPNIAALDDAMHAAGFASVQLLAVAPHHERQYVTGDRAVVTGSAPAGSP